MGKTIPLPSREEMLAMELPIVVRTRSRVARKYHGKWEYHDIGDIIVRHPSEEARRSFWHLPNPLSDHDLKSLIARHGLHGSLVRAVQQKMGWHPPHRGEVAPEWYEAFRGWLGDAIEKILEADPTLGQKVRNK